MESDMHHELCCIALSLAKYVGPINARYLLEEAGSVEAIFAGRAQLQRLIPELRPKVLAELYNPALMQRAEEIARWCKAQGVALLFVGDEGYPALLKECRDAPILLYVKGSLEDWNAPCSMSVVGTRNMSAYGQGMLRHMLGGLQTYFPDTLVVSGLAYGVDIEAHRLALELSMPTVAVLAHGLDRIYPSVHSATAREIVSRGGALVSEYPPGVKPERYHFVARNRIIAGLTKACLVVEAGAKSGSLITAELAAGYDREVLAVPGRVGDRYSEGCNELIASLKGVLTRDATDIVRTLGWEQRGQVLEQRLALEVAPPVDHPILRLIGEKQPIHFNDILRQTGYPLPDLSTELFHLELDGHIKTMPGSLYVLS